MNRIVSLLPTRVWAGRPSAPCGRRKTQTAHGVCLLLCL